MYGYQARPQIRYLEEHPEAVPTMGPWTREMYREIGIDLNAPDWPQQLEAARKRWDVID